MHPKFTFKTLIVLSVILIAPAVVVLNESDSSDAYQEHYVSGNINGIAYQGNTRNWFSWWGTPSDSNVTLISCDKAKSGSVTIPFKVDLWVSIPWNVKIANCEVHTIAAGSFQNCNKITSISITNGVERIEDYAFAGCTSLTSIYIPPTVNYIGAHAFDGCTSLQYVSLPSKITTIRDYTFTNCYSLTEVSLSATYTIAPYAFSNCSSLVKINLPNTLSNIGAHAFEGCKSLTSISIPTNVTKINENTFYNCTALQTVQLGAVKNIADYAFYNCSSLHNIIFPNALNTIGKSAFEKSGLVAINLPNSMNTIGESAFRNCTLLNNAYVPTSVTSLPDNVFYNCFSLRDVSIAGVTEINNHTFRSCTALVSITLSNNLTKIGAYAFGDCSSLQNIPLPGSLKTIGNNAFDRCTSLKSITLPSSLTSLGDYSFRHCSALEEVYNNSSIKSINKTIFDECVGLLTVSIPSTVTSIDIDAFRTCTRLNAIEVDPSNGTFSSIDGVLYSKNMQKLILFPSGKSVEIFWIHEGTTEIGSHSVYGASNIKAIHIPDSVRIIRAYAFQNISDLDYIHFGSGLTWDKYEPIFTNISLHDVKTNNGCFLSAGTNTTQQVIEKIAGQTFVKIGKTDNIIKLGSISTIYEDTANGSQPFTISANPQSNIFEISDDNLVTKIGGKSWTEFGTDAKGIVVGSKLIVVGHGDVCPPTGYNQSIPPEVTTIVFTEGITGISQDAFNGLSSITSITFPSTIDSIGDRAFDNTSIGQGVVDLSAIYDCMIGVRAFGDFHFIPRCIYYSGEPSNDIVQVEYGDIAAIRQNNVLNIVGSGNLNEIITIDGAEIIDVVVIHNGVTSIGEEVFSKIPNVKAFEVKNNDCFRTRDGHLYNQNFSRLIAYAVKSESTTFEILNDVKDVNGSGIQNASALQQILVSLNNNAFSSYNGLLYNKDCTTLIAVPSGFVGHITFHPSMRTVSNDAFSGSRYIEEIFIEKTPGESITLYGSVLIKSEKWLKIACEDGMVSLITQYGDSDTGFAMFNDDTAYIFDSENTDQCNTQALGNNPWTVYIGPGINTISASSFRDTAIVEVVLPADLITIEAYAFYQCSDLESIVDCASPNNMVALAGVHKIGDSAFDGCSDLKTAIDLEMTETIGSDVFSGCTSIASLSIPRVKGISWNAFSGLEFFDGMRQILENEIIGHRYSNDNGRLMLDNEVMFISINATCIGDKSINDCWITGTGFIESYYDNHQTYSGEIKQNFVGFAQKGSILKLKFHVKNDENGNFDFVGWFVEDKLLTDKCEITLNASGEIRDIECRFSQKIREVHYENTEIYTYLDVPAKIGSGSAWNFHVKISDEYAHYQNGTTPERALKAVLTLANDKGKVVVESNSVSSDEYEFSIGKETTEEDVVSIVILDSKEKSLSRLIYRVSVVSSEGGNTEVVHTGEYSEQYAQWYDACKESTLKITVDDIHKVQSLIIDGLEKVDEISWSTSYGNRTGSIILDKNNEGNGCLSSDHDISVTFVDDRYWLTVTCLSNKNISGYLQVSYANEIYGGQRNYDFRYNDTVAIYHASEIERIQTILNDPESLGYYEGSIPEAYYIKESDSSNELDSGASSTYAVPSLIGKAKLKSVSIDDNGVTYDVLHGNYYYVRQIVKEGDSSMKITSPELYNIDLAYNYSIDGDPSDISEMKFKVYQVNMNAPDTGYKNTAYFESTKSHIYFEDFGRGVVFDAGTTMFGYLEYIENGEKKYSKLVRLNIQFSSVGVDYTEISENLFASMKLDDDGSNRQQGWIAPFVNNVLSNFSVNTHGPMFKISTCIDKSTGETTVLIHGGRADSQNHELTGIKWGEDPNNHEIIVVDSSDIAEYSNALKKVYYSRDAAITPTVKIEYKDSKYNASAGIFIEIKYSTGNGNKPISVSGGIYLDIECELFRMGGPYTIYGIPMYWEVGVDLESKTQVGLKLTYDNGSNTLESTCKLGMHFKEEFTISVYGESGAGLRGFISAGIGAKGALVLKLSVMDDKGNFNVGFRLNGYFKLKIGFIEIKPETRPINFQLINKDFDPHLMVLALDELLSENPDSSVTQYQVSDYTYTVNRTLSWDGNAQLLRDWEYADADPQIRTIGKDTIMVFSSISGSNLSTFYSWYDGEYWSYPIQVTNRAGIEEGVQLISLKDKAYLIWSAADAETVEKIRSLSEISSEDFEELMRNEELCFAEWNTDTKRFESFEIITNNEYSEMNPTLISYGNDIAAVWSNEHSVYLSKRVNGVWGSPELIFSNDQYIIQDYSAMVDPNGSVLLEVELINTDDLEVIHENAYIGFSGFGNYGDVSSVRTYGDDTYFISRGMLYRYHLPTGTTQEITDLTNSNYQVISSENKTLVYWISESIVYGAISITEEGVEKFYGPVKLLDPAKDAKYSGYTYVELLSASLAYTPFGELDVVYTIGVSNRDGADSLKYSDDPVLVAYAHLNQDGSFVMSNLRIDEFVSGPAMTFNFELENTGLTKISGVSVFIDDTNLIEYKFDTPLYPGQSEEATISYPNEMNNYRTIRIYCNADALTYEYGPVVLEPSVRMSVGVEYIPPSYTYTSDSLEETIAERYEGLVIDNNDKYVISVDYSSRNASNLRVDFSMYKSAFTNMAMEGTIDLSISEKVFGYTYLLDSEGNPIPITFDTGEQIISSGSSGQINLVVPWDNMGLGYERSVHRIIVINMYEGDTLVSTFTYLLNIHNSKLITVYIDLDEGRLGAQNASVAIYGYWNETTGCLSDGQEVTLSMLEPTKIGHVFTNQWLISDIDGIGFHVGQFNVFPNHDIVLKPIYALGTNKISCGTYGYVINEADYGTTLTVFGEGVLGTNWSSHFIDHDKFTCKGKLTVNLVGNFTEIPDRAFSMYSSLTTVIIPPSVTKISANAFEGCSSLTTIKITSDHSERYSNLLLTGDSVFTVKDGMLFQKLEDGSYELTFCPMGRTFSSPQVNLDYENMHVTSIADGAFNSNTYLKSIVAPEVKHIGHSAFMNCSSLDTVKLPSIITVDNAAFSGCSSLRFIKVDNENSQATEGCVLLGNSLEHLGNRPENESASTSGSAVFSNCIGLESVDLNGLSNLKYIGGYCFNGCTNLREITFPAEGNLELGAYVLQLTSIEEITLSAAISKINELTTFRNMYELKAFTGTNEHYASDHNGFLYTINGDGLWKLVQAVAVPEDCTDLNLDSNVYDVSSGELSKLRSIDIISFGEEHSASNAYMYFNNGGLYTNGIALQNEYDALIVVLNNCIPDDGKLFINSDNHKIHIRPYALVELDRLKCVELGENVEAVNTSAFVYCTNLEQIILDAGTFLENGSFWGTVNIQTVLLKTLDVYKTDSEFKAFIVNSLIASEDEYVSLMTVEWSAIEAAGTNDEGYYQIQLDADRWNYVILDVLGGIYDTSRSPMNSNWYEGVTGTYYRIVPNGASIILPYFATVPTSSVQEISVGWVDKDTSESLEKNIDGLYELTVNDNKSLLITYSRVYKIDYVIFGGSNSSSNPQTYTVFSENIDLYAPQREGYNFLGWFYSADYTGSSIWTIESGSIGDLQLFAKWGLISYDIQYVMFDGTMDPNNPNPDIYSTVFGIKSFSNPIRIGYDFMGWYLDDIFSVKVDTIEPGSYGNRTMYAKWEISHFNITYITNGGSISEEDPRDYTMFDEVTLNNPSRDFYNFIGWFTDPNFAEGSELSGMQTGTVGDVTVYAKWEAYKFHIHYNNWISDENMGENSPHYVYGIEQRLDAVEKLGYTFLGWYLDPEFNNKIETIPVGSYGEYELYAKWSINTYKITYNLNGGTVQTANPTMYTVETGSIDLAAAVKEGYTFRGWSQNGIIVGVIAEGSVGDISLIAVFDINQYSYSVEYVDSEGNSIAPTTTGSADYGCTIDCSIPQITGYTSPTDQKDMIIGIHENRVSYVYIINTYSVTYLVDGEKQGETEWWNFSSEVMLRAPFEKEGYTVTGWDTADVTIAEGRFVVPANNIIFSASTTINQYTAIYKVDGQQIGETESWDYATCVQLHEKYQKEGYTVTDWSTTDVSIENGWFTVPANNIVFVATTTVNSYPYIIKYTDEEGTEIASPLQGISYYGNKIEGMILQIAGFHSPTTAQDMTISTDGNSITYVYSPIFYDITYLVDGNLISGGSYRYGAAIELIAPPEDIIIDGKTHSFSHWDDYTEGEGVYSNMTLRAIRIETASVSQQNNGFSVDESGNTAVISSAQLSRITESANTNPDTSLNFRVGTATVSLDNNALKHVKISDATLSVSSLNPEDMSTGDRILIGDRAAFSIDFGSNKSFGDGFLTITIPYQPSEEENTDYLVVYYVSGGQIVDKIDCTYENGFVTFKTNHLSTYVIGYEEPYTPNYMAIILSGAILLISVGLIYSAKKKHARGRRAF